MAKLSAPVVLTLIKRSGFLLLVGRVFALPMQSAGQQELGWSQDRCAREQTYERLSYRMNICKCSCVVSHIGTSSAHAVAKVQTARKHPYGDLLALSKRPLLRPCTGYKTENQKRPLG